jgi:hypothetical protein
LTDSAARTGPSLELLGDFVTATPPVLVGSKWAAAHPII